MASNINPDPFTTRPEIEGTFGVVTSTHWIATAVGMATLEKGGNAFDAGVATAFTLQVVEPHLNGPGGDVPVIVHDVKRGKHRSDLRPGSGAGEGDDRALQERGAGDGARHRAARGLRARHVRILDAAAARLRHHAAARRAGARDRLCPRRLSAGRARLRHDPDRRAIVPQALADLGRGLSAEWRSAEARHHLHQQDAVGDLCAHPERSRERRRRPRRADRARAQSLVARLCRRSDRQVLPHASSDGCLGLAAQGRAVGRRHGALGADGRSAADLRLWPLHRAEGRRLEPGSGDAAAARAAEGLSISTGSIPPAPNSSISRSNAPSSLTPTARNSMAIPSSTRSRSRRCCRMPTTTSAAS